MAGSLKKVLIVTNIPNPYRIPFFNELNRRLKDLNIHLKIVFGASIYSRRKFILSPAEFEFDYEILPSRTFHFGNNEKTIFTYSKLLREVNKFCPDKIVVTGFSPATLKLWWRSFFRNTNYIIWSGSVLRNGRNDSFLRKVERRLLLKRASGCIAYGTKAKEYLIESGVPGDKVTIAINTVDTYFYSNETNKFRLQLQAENKKHLTFLGYLVPRKNVQVLFSAIRLLAENRKDFILDIIGDGEQKPELEKLVIEKKLQDFVVFHGFKQKKEIPFYFSKSNIFLFQTDFDIWGLVLNEAMAAGIPCLASVNAGATFDLVKEGETGFAIDFNDHNKVAEKINWLLDHPAESKEIGENAAKFIAEKASIHNTAEDFIRAILI